MRVQNEDPNNLYTKLYTAHCQFSMTLRINHFEYIVEKGGNASRLPGVFSLPYNVSNRSMKHSISLFVWGFTPYQQYFSYLTATVHKSMFAGLLLPTLNQSIILTLAGQSHCYSNNPEHQRGEPLLPVLKTLVCRGRGSNPRPPAHEADALTKNVPSVEPH